MENKMWYLIDTLSDLLSVRLEYNFCIGKGYALRAA